MDSLLWKNIQQHNILFSNGAALFPVSKFTYLGAIYIFPGLIWNLYFPVLRERTLGSTAVGAEKRAGNWQRLAAVPCPPLLSCGWAESWHKWPTYKFPIGTIIDREWNQLILVANFLFGLRVNEIPNKTFILDSHWPFICSVTLRALYLNACQRKLRTIIIQTVLMVPYIFSMKGHPFHSSPRPLSTYISSYTLIILILVSSFLYSPAYNYTVKKG